MSATTSQPSEGDWLEHKNLIRDEYLVNNTSLKDLIDLLRAHGLHASKWQLEVKLRNWNFSKNIDKETWQYVDRQIRKRKDEGKDSDVIHCGRRLKKLKVTKETNRHREMDVLARFRPHPPSPKNPQLSICTPPTFQMSFEWPSSLPWLHLQKTSWNTNATVSESMKIQQMCQINAARSLVMALLTRGHESQSISLSEVITGTNNLMPECHPEEHVRTAQNLLAGPAFESLTECLKVVVYTMSNSILIEGNQQVELLSSLIEFRNIDIKTHLRKLRNESPTIRAFLERLFHSEIEDATSSLGQSNVPRPLHLLTWLLELGQDPNYYYSIFIYQDRTSITPIQKAVHSGYLELVQLLLRFHARPDLAQGSTYDEALVNLALDSRCSDVDKVRIIESLFDHKFLSIDEILRAAIELRNTALMRRILQYGPDVTSYETSWLHPAGRRRQKDFKPHLGTTSALMMAVEVGDEIAELMLDYVSQNCQPAPSVLADASLAAVYGGHYALMLRLDAIHVPGKLFNAFGITPLQAAVVGGNPFVCKYLLEQHGGSSASLILAAAILGNVEIVQLLIECGGLGDPNALLCRLDNEWYDYFNIPNIAQGLPLAMLTALLRWKDHEDLTEEVCIVLIGNGATLEPGNVAELSRRGYHRCLEVALRAGGNPNDEDGCKHTALQCALASSWPLDEKEDTTSRRFLTVELLINAGANLRGGEVVRAIDLHEQDLVFCLLRNHGTLKDVDEMGKGCLEAEIQAQNDSSIQDILEMQEYPIDAGPFCAAILKKDWDLVGRLFEKVHIPTNCHLLEGTAVGLAAEAGELDILNKLLARFSHLSVLESAILPISIDEREIKVLRRYRDGSAYWRTATDEDRIEGSPLALAALGGHTCGFRQLLCHGCSMDRISWKVVAESERTSEYLEVLRELGTSIGISTRYDSELNPALCSAIEMGKRDLMRYLVEVGADINELDVSSKSSRSPLQTALLKDNMNMAAYLLENGATVNVASAFDLGSTALQCAASRGHIGFAVRLLQLGARVNKRGSGMFARSALEEAAEHGRLDMLALLLHYGAVTTGRGRQQLVLSVVFAQSEAHHCIAKWLKDKCGWTDADQDLSERVDAEGSMVALWLFLGLLALSTESAADGPCETSLGSSAVDTIHTSTTTWKGTITITDKIIIQTVPLNVTKSKARLSRVTVTDKSASQRNITVGNNTRPTDIRANPSTVGITKTTTITTTFTKLATVTAYPEAKIAIITVTMTVWTAINETQYPAGLATTVTTTVNPIQTALTNVTKTITADESVTLERRIPQKTHYQVCDQNSSNYLSWAPGANPSDKRMIKEFSRQDHEVNPTEIKVSDRVACCNECMKRKHCRVSFWGRPPGAIRKAPHKCYLYITVNWRQCMDGAQPLYARYMADLQALDPITAPWFIFSNGPCGQLKFGGVKNDKWHKPPKHDGFDKWKVLDANRKKYKNDDW
ncbi:Sex-determining fem-1 [Fusarium subglutinans]|uniref:Sex-determining fem-1 n=1 Tax=Gibberella subglutinans TaxID=42677 RepID=A0A8H5UP58_GIBSU|nr:Sex-determining fem-1 [Fusarium subglutinans]KAF5594152.1 Sex-determining fem-1 [Fusarium subglutinans]